MLNTIFLLLPLHVFAAEESVKTKSLVKASSVINHDSMSSNYLLQLVVGLFVVLVCIVALAWVAKKMNRFRQLTDDSLKIIGGLSMGARERIVLLQVGENQLLVGVSPGRINTLHVLDKPIETLDNNPDESLGKNFSDKLKTIMNNAKNDPTKKNRHEQ